MVTPVPPPMNTSHQPTKDLSKSTAQNISTMGEKLPEKIHKKPVPMETTTTGRLAPELRCFPCN